MKRWSLKVKVGVYAALLAMVALAAGAAVLMPVLYYHQLAQLDESLKSDADELLRDLQNFRGAPVDPRRPLSAKFIPLSLRGRYLIIEGPEHQFLYQSPNLRGMYMPGHDGKMRTIELFGRNCRVGSWQEGPYHVHVGTAAWDYRGFPARPSAGHFDLAADRWVGGISRWPLVRPACCGAGGEA